MFFLWLDRPSKNSKSNSLWKINYGIFPEFILSRFKNPTTKIFDQYFIFEIETRHNFFVGGICIRHFTHKCTDIHLHLYTHKETTQGQTEKNRSNEIQHN